MKKTTIIFVLILSILAAFLPTYSNALAQDSEHDTASFRTTLYNVENGLYTNDANDVVQTADGFIWIGGYGGLIRYDGNTFYNYSLKIETS